MKRISYKTLCNKALNECYYGHNIAIGLFELYNTQRMNDMINHIEGILREEDLTYKERHRCATIQIMVEYERVTTISTDYGVIARRTLKHIFDSLGYDETIDEYYMERDAWNGHAITDKKRRNASEFYPNADTDGMVDVSGYPYS